MWPYRVQFLSNLTLCPCLKICVVCFELWMIQQHTLRSYVKQLHKLFTTYILMCVMHVFVTPQQLKLFSFFWAGVQLNAASSIWHLQSVPSLPEETDREARRGSASVECWHWPQLLNKSLIIRALMLPSLNHWYAGVGRTSEWAVGRKERKNRIRREKDKSHLFFFKQLNTGHIIYCNSDSNHFRLWSTKMLQRKMLL